MPLVWLNPSCSQSPTINICITHYSKEGIILWIYPKWKIKDKNEAITLINVIVYCNVDILDYNKVLFLLEKAIELIHSNNQDTCSFEYWIAKSDYSTIIYYLITIYYPDNKKEKRIDLISILLL